MEKLNNMCKFPWLMANVLDVETDKPLGGAGTHMMMTHCGRKVGIVGLVEEEWIATLGTVKPDQVRAAYSFQIEYCGRSRLLPRANQRCAMICGAVICLLAQSIDKRRAALQWLPSVAHQACLRLPACRHTMTCRTMSQMKYMAFCCDTFCLTRTCIPIP